jgi:3-deoxy-manno-octulosonate cytidylyltransferase (CMP-KDO synthetase)
MKVVGIIPARLGSTRMPQKMLADINGKPLIQHTYEHAKKATVLDELIVATDSREIFETVKEFGGKAVMTSKHNKSGTDRAADAARNIDCDIVVNIQGDEAFVPAEAISLAVEVLNDNAEAVMGTIACPIVSEEEYLDRNVVKVVIDNRGKALYFTRAPVPHSKSGKMDPKSPCYKHMGIYSYRREFLLNYADLGTSALEDAEDLEQLRALENGFEIRVAVLNRQVVKIDTMEELEKARKAGR